VNSKTHCRWLGGSAMGEKVNWQMGKCDHQLASCTGAKLMVQVGIKLANFQVS